MTSLDFRKRKKAYLAVTLPDEGATRLSVMQPTKELFQKMTDMSERVGSMAGADLDALDEVYEVCAELMSRNRQGITLAKEQLEATLDFEDIVVFLRAYSSFVAELVLGEELSVPFYPLEDEGTYDYPIFSYWEKVVADYLRISVLEVEGLDYLDYLAYRRDAFLYETGKTEAGREYLENAYRLEQASMPRASRHRLREMFGRPPRSKGDMRPQALLSSSLPR